MASPEILDIGRLAAPIEGDSPVGTDLRADPSPMSVYYQVKDTRSQARAAERQALMNGDEEITADWRPILELAPDVIAGTSKDLELSAYLIEALAREHGFPGLRDGFRLVKELIQQYGDDIFPLPDEDGVETRVAPLTGLNGESAEGTLIAPINAIPITDYTSVGRCNTSDYLTTIEMERMSDEARERRIEQGAVSGMDFQIAVAETSAEFYRNLLDDLESAIEEFTQLSAMMDEKYGYDAPPTSNIKTALETVRETINTIAGDKLAMTESADDSADSEETDDDGGSAENGAAPKAKPAGTIETRDDAFRMIGKVAEFFRRTEPHTPISYALERIVRWGRMPLPDLLKELIVDETTVDQMFKLVGIPKPTSSNEYEE